MLPLILLLMRHYFTGCSRGQETGNILFLILLAVVLFAALAYAVTNSMRGGGKDGGSEGDQAKISAMLNFMADIETFMTRARLVDGVKDEEFTYRAGSSDDYLVASGNADCWNYNAGCTRTACRIFKSFNPNGIVAQKFESWTDSRIQGLGYYAKNGHLVFRQLAIKDVGTSAPEVVGVISGIPPAMCNRINAQQGITTNLNENSTLTDVGETYGTSRPEVLNMGGTCGVTPTDLSTTNILGDENPQYAGKKVMCISLRNSGISTGGASVLGLLYVLIER